MVQKLRQPIPIRTATATPIRTPTPTLMAIRTIITTTTMIIMMMDITGTTNNT